MHNLLKHATEMFPTREVEAGDCGVEIDFGEDWPSITSAQVAALAKHDESGVTIEFLDRSRYCDSCTIYHRTLVIVSPAAAADR